MNYSILSFCVLMFLSAFVVSSAQNQCRLPNGENGTCLPFRDCPAMHRILMELTSTTQISEADKNYLRQAQCGWKERQPLVCCTRSPRFIAADLPKAGVECGLQSSDRLGVDAVWIGEFKSIALLQYSKPEGRKGFHCGGVIINKNYVLTAAHCIAQSKYLLESVRLGEHDLRTDPDCEDGECADPVVDVPVAETIIHENYDANSTSQHDDIALIRLSRPITFSDWIAPICLPISQQLRAKNFSEAQLQVAGFGKTEKESNSDVKQARDVHGLDSDRCNNVYKPINIEITMKQLCSSEEYWSNSCRVDSGGPLMGTDILNRFRPYIYLAGLESIRPRKCEAPGWPVVYTKTSEYVDWILNHMRH